MSAGKAKKKSGGGGRRRNYAPAGETEGVRSRLPTGWANWLGFCLFLVCGVAVIAWALVYVVEANYADAVVATMLGAALFYMVYLFGTTRLRV